MSTRNTMIVSLVFVMVAFALSSAVYGRLPEEVASHWNANDEVNGTLARFWSAFLMPLMSLGMLGLFMLIPNIDPLKANVEKFRDAFNAFITLIIASSLNVMCRE